MSRPKLKIDEDEVARLALLNCHTRTIAEKLGVDEKTLRNRFSALLKKKRAEHRINLRKAQAAKVEAKDTAMLIFLGKNELDQADRKDVKIGGQKGNPLIITIIEAHGTKNE